MGNIAFGQYLGAYIGIAMLMLELITITLSVSALLILYANKDKIKKAILYIAYSVLGFVLLTSLYYALSSLFKSNWI